MSFKKVKVVMLPTNEKAPNHDYLFLYKPSNRLVKDGFVQNLYFLSDEKIKEGDWIYDEDNGVVKIEHKYQLSNINVFRKDCKKIIATTDKSIILPERFPSFTYLPQPSQSFIEKFVEEYNKGNVITEVMVEYENYYASGALQPNLWQLKISKDHTITIRKVKDSWNRDEVRELLITAYSKGRTNILLREFNEWLKENL